MAKKIILYTAPGWCGPCRALKNNGGAAKFEERHPGCLEIVDLTEPGAADSKKAEGDGVKSVPTAILVDGRKELARATVVGGIRDLEKLWGEGE